MPRDAKKRRVNVKVHKQAPWDAGCPRITLKPSENETKFAYASAPKSLAPASTNYVHETMAFQTSSAPASLIIVPPDKKQSQTPPGLPIKELLRLYVDDSHTENMRAFIISELERTLTSLPEKKEF